MAVVHTSVPMSADLRLTGMTNEDDKFRAEPDPNNPMRLQPKKGPDNDAAAMQQQPANDDGVEAPPGISEKDQTSGPFRRHGA